MIVLKMHRNQYKMEKLTILTPQGPGERAPVSLDTKCTLNFGGFSHKSVENAQKSIQNGMTDITEPPSRTQLSLTMPFQMKVLEMHRKQSTPPPQLQLSHAANWRR